MSGEPEEPASLPLEPAPTPEQRERLEGWLTELLIISRRYGILLDQVTCEGTVQLLDTHRDTLIGLDLIHLTNQRGQITAYLPVDSILDGVWLVDSQHGSVEQRTLGTIFPIREPLE